MAFRKKAAYILAEDPDILIVQMRKSQMTYFLGRIQINRLAQFGMEIIRIKVLAFFLW